MALALIMFESPVLWTAKDHRLDWTATAVHKLMVASPSILETKDWSKPDQIKQLQPVLDRFSHATYLSILNPKNPAQTLF